MSERTYTESELAAERVALLREAAEVALKKRVSIQDTAKDIYEAILAISTNRPALARVEAAARREGAQKAAIRMRDRCAVEAYRAYRAGNNAMQLASSIAANNIRMLPLECPTCNGAGCIRWKEPHMECSKPCPDCTTPIAALQDRGQEVDK